MNRWEVTKSAVPLNKIKALIKDINVIFQTDENDVEVTLTMLSDDRAFIKSDVTESNMFFTGISQEKNNEFFREKMLNAFKKADYSISSEFWYD